MEQFNLFEDESLKKKAFPFGKETNSVSLILSLIDSSGKERFYGRKIVGIGDPILLKTILSSWGRTFQSEEFQNKIADKFNK